MPQPEWEALEREVHDLVRRVAQLEQRIGLAVEVREAEPEPTPATPVPATPLLAETAGLIAVLGRALLGLAGAYLLRALTEAHTLPVTVGIAVGILYAVQWLVWAARTPATRRLEAALHSLTAVLVLVPLLWEATLRFHSISTWTAGILLGLFAIAGMLVSWRRNLLIVSTIATLAALGAAAGLLIATHDVLPFTFVFLAIAAAVEASACLDHWVSERWVAALAADLAVLLATWLVTNEHGLPAVYAPIPHFRLLMTQVTLLGIYLASTTARTLIRGMAFTGFETAQCVAAFAISVSGGLQLSSEDHRLAPAMALLMLACAVASYLVSFAFLERRGGRGRNFYTYSTFAILLTLAATRILLTGMAAAALWWGLAIACIWAGGAFGRLTLSVHGGIYLLLALALSGAPQQAAAHLLGSAAWPGEHATALWAGAVAATAAYTLASQQRAGESASWDFQAFRLVMAAASLWLLAGIAAGGLTGLYHLTFGSDASPAYCATLRTSVLAGLALLLAWAAPLRRRAELERLIYPAMTLGGYRLLTQDLHQDRKLALFLSLVVFGATLMVLPRLKVPRDA